MNRRKNIDPEFEPQVIDEDWDDDHSLAFVPNQIEANDNYNQQLLGYPHNILFGGMALDPQTDQKSLVHVCYEPARSGSRRDCA